MVAGSVPVAVFLNSDIAPALNRMFLHIQETTECTFSLSVKKIKMIKTQRNPFLLYNQLIFVEESYSILIYRHMLASYIDDAKKL